MAINSLSSSYSAAQIASLFSALPSRADTASSKGGATATQPLSPKSIQQSVAASTATLQAIIQSSEANSKAGQSSVSLAASAYSGTASASEASNGSSANGTASGNSTWMSQNIAKFEAAWKEGEVIWEANKQFVPKDLLAADQAYETAVSTAIANHTMTYAPASQAPGLDVCENTTTWATGSETYYGYNGDALNAFVKSQGKNGGLVIWGDTPEESTVALW